MRSNDAFWGLSQDIFAFTMLQEIIACSLGIQLGWYKHAVCSLHLYSDKEANARQYLKESQQPTISGQMPTMPTGNPWIAIENLLVVENLIRNGVDLHQISDINLPKYWQQLAQILQIHYHFKKNNLEEIQKISNDLSDSPYYPYIAKRLRNRLKKQTKDG